MHEPSSCFGCFKLSYYYLKLWTFSMPSNIVSDMIGAFMLTINQARVVQTLDSSIQRINYYPADKY